MKFKVCCDIILADINAARASKKGKRRLEKNYKQVKLRRTSVQKQTLAIKMFKIRLT